MHISSTSLPQSWRWVPWFKHPLNQQQNDSATPMGNKHEATTKNVSLHSQKWMGHHSQYPCAGRDPDATCKPIQKCKVGDLVITKIKVHIRKCLHFHNDYLLQDLNVLGFIAKPWQLSGSKSSRQQNPTWASQQTQMCLCVLLHLPSFPLISL